MCIRDRLHLDQNTLALIDATYDALEQQSDAATIEKSKKMLGQMERDVYKRQELKRVDLI